MKIRSITYFFDPKWPLDENALSHAASFCGEARQQFTERGYEVQTTRLATVPFPQLLDSLEAGRVIRFAQVLETAASAGGYDYVSIGPALPQFPESYNVIPDVFTSTQNVFCSGVMANQAGGVSLPAVRACGEVIHRSAGILPDGFANLRFTALANVPPGAPFFPAAYHTGATPSFAVATEAADLAVEAFSHASSIEDGRQLLIDAVESHAQALGKAGLTLQERYDVSFKGIDFSLAPFPEEARSLGKAMERLGVQAVGMHGSLASAAILAETLDRARFPRTGFSGLILPVLEDASLAARAAEKILTVKDLLLFSAVCGTGLDTLPLPGDTSVEQLAALLLDLAVLAQRLEKPLTARLMPIPGRAAGDPTGFDFPYFANSRVLSLEAAPLRGLLAGDESFSLARRP